MPSRRALNDLGGSWADTLAAPVRPNTTGDSPLAIPSSLYTTFLAIESANSGEAALGSSQNICTRCLANSHNAWPISLAPETDRLPTLAAVYFSTNFRFAISATDATNDTKPCGQERVHMQHVLTTQEHVPPTRRNHRKHPEPRQGLMITRRPAGPDGESSRQLQ
jgi:hypothetical protein